MKASRVAVCSLFIKVSLSCLWWGYSLSSGDEQQQQIKEAGHSFECSCTPCKEGQRHEHQAWPGMCSVWGSVWQGAGCLLTPALQKVRSTNPSTPNLQCCRCNSFAKCLPLPWLGSGGPGNHLCSSRRKLRFKRPSDSPCCQEVAWALYISDASDA